MRTTEPVYITQGEQITWTRSFDGFPSDEWDLQYRFRGPGQGFNIDATPSSSSFEATATALQTGGMASGQYIWQAWMTNILDTDDTREVDAGSVTVKRGFVEDPTTEIDLRTTAKQIVDALEAALLGSASQTQMEYEISTPAGSRRVKYMSRKEQTDMLTHYKTIVARELAAERLRNGGKYGMQIKVRMRST